MRKLGQIVALALILAFPVVIATSLPVFAAPAADDAGGEMPGMAAFTAQKCNMCHSIEAKGIERTSKSDKMMAADLSTVGADHDAAWIVGFLKKTEMLDGEEHKKDFKGTDEEAQQIADWLATLK